jgi:hypothetical protein
MSGSRRFFRAARAGFVIGACVGVLDGARVLPTPATALDRLATMGVALLIDATAVALLGLLIALLTWPISRRRGAGEDGDRAPGEP